MRKTLMASAAVLALTASGYALANPCSDGKDSCNQTAAGGSNTSGASATSSQTSGSRSHPNAIGARGASTSAGWATASQTSGSGANSNEIASGAKVYQDSFNTSKAVALGKLN